MITIVSRFKKIELSNIVGLAVYVLYLRLYLLNDVFKRKGECPKYGARKHLKLLNVR